MNQYIKEMYIYIYTHNNDNNNRDNNNDNKHTEQVRVVFSGKQGVAQDPLLGSQRCRDSTQEVEGLLTCYLRR